MMDSFRHGWRALAARPRVTGFAVAMLALGIGANTAMFSVINAMLLRPLPYADPHNLVEISGARIDSAVAESLREAGPFEDIGAFNARNFLVRDEQGTTHRVYGFRVTANLFDVLGVKAAIGRTFGAQDADAPVVLLSYDYWLKISGQPGILGKPVAIAEDRVRSVIGVLPPGFTLQVRDANLFVPYRLDDGRMVGRLKSNVSATQAAQQAEAVVTTADNQGVPPSGRAVHLTPLTQSFRPGSSVEASLFQAALGLVLLILCANLANLMLVSGYARRRELAVRAALGAGRRRLVGQLLAENLMLALAGGALGLLLASASLDAIAATLPPNMSRMLRGADGLSIDASVTGFAILLSLAALALFGLAPAAGALRFDLVEALRSSGRGSSTGRPSGRTGALLMTVEVALALMLLVAAGLTLKDLMALRNRQLGFTGEHVLRSAIELPRSRYPSAAGRRQALGAFLERVRGLPGVEGAAIVGPQLFPFGGPRIAGAVFAIPGSTHPEPRAEFFYATPDYFRTLRIPLLKGRPFTSADSAVAPPVAIVSEIVARRYWPQQDPLGRLIRRSPGEAPATIVGVAGNVRNPVGMDFTPVIYQPLEQVDVAGGTVMLRSGGKALALAPAVYAEERAADPDAVEFRPAELSEVVADYTSPQRFATSLFGIFAGAGLLLAALGIFAVMRNWVEQRVPEIGIRMALGAGSGEVLRHVMGRALAGVGAGLGLGMAGAWALRRVLGALLHDVKASDPAIILGVAALTATVSLISAMAPAWRASRVDPAVALRRE